MSYLMNWLLLVTYFCNLLAANQLGQPAVALRGLSETKSLTLSAVSVRRLIEKRGDNFIPKHECEHSYVDHEAVLDGTSAKFAITSMKYILRAVILEDIEHDMVSLQCSETSLSIEFSDIQSLITAKESWSNFSKFLIITSHSECNKDGERAVYEVTGVTYKSGVLVELTTHRLKWRDAYNSMTVRFGTSKDKYDAGHLRIHDDLRRRHEETRALGTTQYAEKLYRVVVTEYSDEAINVLAAASSSVSFPSPPSVTPTATLAALSVNTQVPANSEILSVSVDSNSVQVRCKNCTIAGAFEITDGGFTVHAHDRIGEAIDFLENGYIKMSINGLAAHIELDSSLSLSASASHNIALGTPNDFPGFQIPGLAVVAPVFSPNINVLFGIVDQVDFAYGFDLQIPDNTYIDINVGDALNSNSSGLDQTQVNALSFTASRNNITFELRLALRMQFLLGINILDGDASFSAGAFLDAPWIGANFTELDGVNYKCDKATGSNTVNDILGYIFPNLLNVVPSYGWDLGAQGGGQIGVKEIPASLGATKHYTQAGATMTLPTACLLWDAVNTKFVSPTIPGTSPTTTSKSNVGVQGRNNPMLGERPFLWTAGLFLTVFFIAILL